MYILIRLVTYNLTSRQWKLESPGLNLQIERYRKDEIWLYRLFQPYQGTITEADVYQNQNQQHLHSTLLDCSFNHLICTIGMPWDMNWNVDEIDLKDDHDLRQLPDSPVCPILVKLFLQGPGFTVIPPTFFEHMPVLQVLDLSNTSILSLPISISRLSLLREFFLRDCSSLMELPAQIGMLSNLKLFDINGTELMLIPKETGKLKELEVLRVSLSQYAKDYIKTKGVNETVIPKNMILELKQLKELCISVPPEAEWWEEEVKRIQNELCDLENLETLRWYLPTNEVLQQFLLLERNHLPIYANLSNLMLTIGQHAQLTSCLPHDLEKKFEEFRNCLKWINAEGNMDDISKITARAEALFLSRHWAIKKLSTINITYLKYCLLAECNEMETLVEADGLSEDVETRINNGEKIGLELLQYVSIHHMKKLQSIWKGPIGKDSLSKLRILALHSCPQLTSIFTLNVAQNLSCLTELTVEDCPKVRSLISNESHNVKHGPIFPTLDRIFLLDLPELVNIFGFLIILEELSTLLIYNCLNLRYLSITYLPHIKKIEGEMEWWKALDCDKSAWENIFVPLKRKRDLVEKLFEARNSLQHFHDTVSHEAVADANKAIELDPSNPKAYFRKGTACFNLEEYQTAKIAFEAGSTLNPEDARFPDWIKKCDKCIAEKNGYLPTQSSDATPTNVVASSSTTKDAEQIKDISNELITTPSEPRFRHKFYQKREEVVVVIFARGIPANNVSINFGEQILSVTIDVPGKDPYIFQPRLFGKIVPTKCRFDVLSTIVEIRLAKAESIHWTSLEFVNNIVQQGNVSTGMIYDKIFGNQAKQVVLKVLNMTDDKTKRKAVKAVSSIRGVESIAADMKDQKLIVIGEIDPVILVHELKKVGNAVIISVEEKKKEKEKRAEKDKVLHSNFEIANPIHDHFLGHKSHFSLS
ncbi:hypothetical protein L1987_54877 [Smallanthus sonchifolius]|uniref:Uncharacterized protein n=1 Tax=Smallanthus sonchifolius TaxID=185202 RepID=A0ACB9E806_9ASTR|nr:hypothetical protein L1987_54877 [Smallanthus sonchifolius]